IAKTSLRGKFCRNLHLIYKPSLRGMSETIDEAIFFDGRDCRVAVDPRNDECSTSLWGMFQ
ncbi:hypothetical protein, partial [Fibrobacter intestinalis]|uniref:hypothetical protein n=1 Tax=Fibrobacter intestinalis TaxID=28122 RepID=UPI001F48E572